MNTTNNTDTAAKCANSCAGGCSMGANGCKPGQRELSEAEARAMPAAYWLTPPGSGRAEIEEMLARGSRSSGLISRCTDCMEGQGRNCHCMSTDLDSEKMLAYLLGAAALVMLCAAGVLAVYG